MRIETASTETAAKGKGEKKTSAATKGRKKTAEEVETLSPPAKRRSLAVEEKYQKMTQREHIIKRPDTYSRHRVVPSHRIVGSVEKLTQEMWVYDSAKKGLVYRNVTFVRVRVTVERRCQDSTRSLTKSS